MLNSGVSSGLAPATATMALGRLRSASADQVRAFWRSVERYPSGTNLGSGLHAGATHAIILSGWACEMCILPDGRRQIFSIFLPGDRVEVRRNADLSARSFVALTRLELVNSEHRAIIDPSGPARGAKAKTGLRRCADERLFVHMTRLGQLNAQERVLSLLLELYTRLDAVNLVKDDTFRLPLSQETLADTLGLSIVHLNRTIRQLRAAGTIALKARMVTLPMRTRLSILAPHIRDATASGGREPREGGRRGRPI